MTRRRLIAPCLTVCAVPLTACQPIDHWMARIQEAMEYRRGALEAHQSIINNRLEIRVYGLVHPDSFPPPAYRAYLADRNIVFVAKGCLLSSRAFMAGYQDTIETEIARRHGSDFWDRARLEAGFSPQGAPDAMATQAR